TVDGVEPDGGALVGAGVADQLRAADDDLARADGVDAAARVAGVVVADDGVVQRQRPGRVDGVLHEDAAAGARGAGVGHDAVVGFQAGVAGVADGAAAHGAVAEGGGDAVLQDQSLQCDLEGGGGVGVVGVEGGVDVEDAVVAAAVDDDPAATGVDDGQV